MRDALAANENIYTVAVRSSEGTVLSTIGALTRVLVAPEDPSAVIDAIDDGLIPGPRVLVATLALAATASYAPGPRGWDTLKPALDQRKDRFG